MNCSFGCEENVNCDSSASSSISNLASTSAVASIWLRISLLLCFLFLCVLFVSAIFLLSTPPPVAETKPNKIIWLRLRVELVFRFHFCFLRLHFRLLLLRISALYVKLLKLKCLIMICIPVWWIMVVKITQRRIAVLCKPVQLILNFWKWITLK